MFWSSDEDSCHSFYIFKFLEMKKIEDRAVELERKNKELEERKRQIEEELKNLNANEDDEDIEFGKIAEEDGEDYHE